MFKGKTNKKVTAIGRELQNNKKKSNQKEKKEKRKIKKTTIDTLPYIKMCQHDILKIDKNVYSKTFKFTDTNYSTMKQEEQEGLFISYGKILNYFSPLIDVQISVINSMVDVEEFNEKILYKEDDYDISNDYKKEYNNVLKSLMLDKKNKIMREKFITLTIGNKNFNNVISEFQNIEYSLKSSFLQIGSTLKVVENNEKSHIIKKIFRGVDIKMPKFTQKEFDNQMEKNFIVPDYFAFRPAYFMFNNTYAQTLILRNLPSFLDDKLITQLSRLETALNISININSVLPAVASKLVSRRLTAIESEKITFTKKAIKNNLPPDILPRDMQHSLEEAKDMWNNLSKNNEKMFLVNVVITLFSEDLEELKLLVKEVKGIASQNICDFGQLFLLQEEAMVTTLPIGKNLLKDKKYQRTLTTNSTAIFMPFDSQTLGHDDTGIFYGIQSNSNNIIYADRKKLMNGNGFILGTSGSGKSVSGKDEISQIFWKYKEDCILIVDPEGEYSPLTKALGGVSIKISPHTDNFINPLDISNVFLEEKNPISTKVSFMITFAELCCGVISAKERSMIDRTLIKLYELAFRQKIMPTLQDFHKLLHMQGEGEKELAMKLEIYCIGSQNIFAHQTNVDIKNRLFSYDIKEVNATLKPIAMLVMLDNIMNQIAENKKKNKYTWIFIDELHLLLKNEQSSIFLEELFKIARKWNGIPTGITQNISDLLESEAGRKMLTNAEYLRILRQKLQDKDQMAILLEISENLINYVKNPEKGCGLIVLGNNIVPFEAKLPEGSKLLKLWGTSEKDRLLTFTQQLK